MNFPQRKLQRLNNYDYSQNGCYFVTIGTHNKIHIFGKISEDFILLNNFGEIAKLELFRIPSHFPFVSLDNYVIMPNHVHVIVVIDRHFEDHGISERSRPFPTVSMIMGLYKSGVSNKIHRINPEIVVWQKSFHDHIIRNEDDYQNILEYINANPLKWTDDQFYIE